MTEENYVKENAIANIKTYKRKGTKTLEESFFKQANLKKINVFEFYIYSY